MLLLGCWETSHLTWRRIASWYVQVEHEPSVPTLSVLLLSCLAFAGAACLRVMLAYQLQQLPELRGVLTTAAALLAIVLDFMVSAIAPLQLLAQPPCLLSLNESIAIVT
jgi:hypothetical protein